MVDNATYALQLQQQGSLYYQPKQCSWKREIPQIDHTFALLDPPKVFNSLTPESPWLCLDIAWIWYKFYIIATDSVLGESGATPHGLKVSCCSLQQRISNRLHCRFSKDSHENMVLKLHLKFILKLKRNQLFENTPFPSNLLYYTRFFKEIKWTWEFFDSHNISSLATWSWFCSFAPPPSRWKICLSTRRVPRWFESQPLGMFTYMNRCFLMANLGKYTSSSHGYSIKKPASTHRNFLLGHVLIGKSHWHLMQTEIVNLHFFVHWSVPSETQHIYVFNGGNHTSVNANWNCIPRWTCWCSRSNPPSCLSDLAAFDCWYCETTGEGKFDLCISSWYATHP